MNAVEQAALLQGAAIYDEVTAGLDDRTLQILERRRRTAKIRRRGWLVRRMLLAADVGGLILAFLLAEFFVHGGTGAVDQHIELLLFAGTLPAWVLAAKIYGLYDHDEERTSHSTVDEIVGVFHLLTVGAWLLLAGAWATGLAEPDLLKVLTFWGLAFAAMTVGRALTRGLARRRLTYLQNTIIVGAGDVGQLIARKFLHHPEYGINLVGFVDAAPKERRDDLESLTVLGPPDRLPGLVRLLDIERVVVAFSSDSHEETLEVIRSLNGSSVQVDVVPRLFELVGPSVRINTVEGLPLVGLPPARISRSSRLVKRLIDVVGALFGLVLTAPLFAVIALKIKTQSPGPVFFRQTRLGLNMKEFTMLKFRTMRADTNDGPHREYLKSIMDAKAAPQAHGLYKLQRQDAVTPFGRWLRKTSLDELPQLWNVLRGEMSLVGPRPAIPYEVENYADHHHERFLVPAGVTGLWQVTARAHATFREALDMDVAYARGWSLGLDLTLILRTLRQLSRPLDTA